nr:helix-turn-helix domain-containing protein [Streptomyces alkaliphilus]
MRRPAIPHASNRPSPTPEEVTTTDRLLTVEEAAERLGTGTRFIRRLIAERRIRYVKLGKPVRVPESALAAYIAERTVPTAAETRAARYGKAV